MGGCREVDLTTNTCFANKFSASTGGDAVEELVFQNAKDEIDRLIDDGIVNGLGIAMSFALAGEFMVRGLLETVHFEFLGHWDARKYRGRYVLPDPMMDGAQFRFGGN